MKKAVVFLLATAMVLSASALFAAGQQGDATTAGGRKILDISVGHTVSKDRVPEKRPALYSETILEKFGIRFAYEDIPGEEFIDKMNLLFATGEYPDYIDSVNGGPRTADYNRWANDGLMRRFDDKLDKVPEYMKQWTDAQWETTYAFNKAADGYLYTLPHKNKRDASMNWIYKKSAFDAIGLEFPTTKDELTNVLKTLKREYSDFIGIVNRAGPNGVWSRMGTMFRTSGGFFVAYDGPHDRLTYGPTMDNFRDLMIYTNMLWKEGLIDPEFATNNYQQWTERFARGQAYILYSWGTRATWAEGVEKNDVDWEYSRVYTGAYDKSLPEVWAVEAPFWNWGPAVSIGATDEEFDRLLEYFNWACTDEGWYFHNFGVEGVTFTFDSNGVPQWMDHMYDAEKNPEGKSLALYGIGYYLRTNGPDTVPRSWGDIVNDDISALATRPGVIGGKQILWDSTKEEQKDLADWEVVLNQVRDEWTMKFQTDVLDPNDDAVWADFQAALKKAGLDKIMALRTKIFNRSPYNKVWPY